MMKAIKNTDCFTEVVDFLNKEEREANRIKEEERLRKQMEIDKVMVVVNRIIGLLQENKIPTLDVISIIRFYEHVPNQ